MKALLLLCLFGVHVKSGEVYEIPNGSKLECQEILVDEGGELRIGSPEQPAENVEVVFLDRPIDTKADPVQLGRGLIVYGKVSIYGKPKTPYVRQRDTKAGEFSITLESSVSGWEPGDLLYLADTRQPAHQWNPARYELQHDFAQLVSITDELATIEKALQWPHKGAVDYSGKRAASPVLANLTRSVTFRSENPAGTRAHAIFMDKAEVCIRNAAFLDMGRTTNAKLDSTVIDASGNVVKVGTNQVGRYPLHFHFHEGPENAMPRGEISGCVVYSQTPLTRWGITVHQSHRELIKDNVVVCCAGSGIVTEDGNESENVFDGNYVSWVTGGNPGDERPDARQGEIGFEGSAFWFRGPDNYVRDNIASNAKDGFIYYARHTSKKFLGLDAKPVDPTQIPLKQFERNECSACSVGFSAWWVCAVDRTPVYGAGVSKVKDCLFWHVRSPVSSYETGNFHYVNLEAIGDPALRFDSNGGIGSSDYLQYRTVIEGGRIENYNNGIRVGSICDAVGASGTNPGLFVIRNTRIRTNTAVTVPIPWHNASAKGLPPVTVHMENLDLEKLPEKTEKRFFNVGVRSSDFTEWTAWLNVRYWHGPLQLRLWGAYQDPEAVIPETSQGGRVQGSPVSMPNGRLWETYGVCGGGELVKDATYHNQMGLFSVVPGSAPRIQPIKDQVVTPGAPWELRLNAYDPTLGELEYSVEGPEGMAVENRSGRLNWPAPQMGKHEVTVSARDVDQPESVGRASFVVTVRMPSG